jgi:hypothetical protein
METSIGTCNCRYNTKLCLQAVLCASFTTGAVLTALLSCVCAVVVMSVTVAGFLLSGVGERIRMANVMQVAVRRT